MNKKIAYGIVIVSILLIVVVMGKIFWFGNIKSDKTAESSSFNPKPIEGEIIIKSLKSENASKDHIVKNIQIDASKYNINKIFADYDSINIQGFKQPRGGLRLPYLRYEVDLPRHAKINDVKIDFSEPVNLKKLNIPIYTEGIALNCGPGCGENTPATFEPNSEKLSISSAQQFKYDVENHDLTKVYITIHPVIFNGETTEATLFRAITINLDYTSAAKGYFISARNDKQDYTVGEEILESIFIKNTSPAQADFKTTVELKDYRGQTVAIKSQKATIASEKEGVVNISIPIPSDSSGTYSITINVFDQDLVIGNQDSVTIQIKPKQNIIIESLQVSDKTSKSKQQYKDYATFIATIKNPTNETFRTFIDFHIYEGQEEIMELPQMFADLGPNETKKVKSDWSITRLDPGFYSVQAIAEVGNFEISSDLETFEVVP